MVRVYMAVASIPGRVHTVKEIDAPVYRFQDVCRCADAHKISRLVLRQVRNDCIQNPIHFLMALANCQTSDRIAIEVHFADFLRVFDTDILVNRTLIDTKQELFPVDRIRQCIEACHLILAARQPARRALH